MSRYDDVGGTDEPASTRIPRGAPRRHLRRRIAAWASVGLTFVLVVATLGVYVEYRNVVDSVRRVNITNLGKRPPKYNNAMNLLVIGSDSRKGRNKRFGASTDSRRRSAALGHGHVAASLARPARRDRDQLPA